MMRSKQLNVIFGVVLFSAAPIFSVAQAQSNAQTSTFLELQKMRQEISELRDMVERQQYQIRKMQKGQSGSSPRGPNSRDSEPNRAQNQSDDDQGFLPAPSSDTDSRYSGSNSNYDSNPASPNRTDGSVYTDQPNSYDDRPNYNDQRGTSGDQGQDQGDGLYDPRAGDGSLQVDPSNKDGSNNRRANQRPDGVEERVINAPPASNDRVNRYPPVEERTIGGASQQVERSAEGLNSQATGQPRLGELPTGRDRYAEQDSGGANAPSQRVEEYQQPNDRRPGGVIAVPPPLNDRVAANTNSADDPASGNSNSSSQGISSVLGESDLYSQGFSLMKQSKFDEAVSVFEQQLKAYPRGDSADDAHYWIAEAMYVSRNLAVAKKHLKTLIQDYPQSQRVPDAMLKTAYIEQQEGNKIEARILFQEIVNHHPKSDAAIAAKNRLAENN